MKKLKLVMSIATMCMAIAVLCFGVLAATSVTYTIEGTISYDVEDVYVDVNTTVYKSAKYLSATEQSRLVETLGNPANLDSAKTEYKLVETGVSNSFSTLNTESPTALSDLALTFNKDVKTYAIVVNVKNLTDKNAWAVVDSVKVNDSFFYYYWDDPNINVRDNYQLSISKDTDTNGRNVVIAVSPQDVTQPLTNSTFSFNLIFGSGEYVDSKTNTDKMIITNNDDGTKSVVGADDISGVLAIPNGVVTIRSDAFNGAYITSVIIPEGVTSIGSDAFYCYNLTSITIPNSLLNPNGFYYVFFDGVCYGRRVYISNLESWFDACFEGERGNPLYDGADLYVNGTILTDLVIPDSITSIGNSAFNGCISIQSVTIPSSVTSIGEYAFYRCSKLNSVTFEEGSKLTSIGDAAFDECSSLTSVTIPNSVTSIGGFAAFRRCSNLTTVNFEEGSKLTSIGDAAFDECSSLKSITIPSSVTSIGGRSFNGCSSLISITIPEGVTSIGGWAFSGCSSFTSITIPSSVTSIGTDAFYNTP